MPIGIVGSQRLDFFEYLVAGNAVLGYPHICPFRGATIVTLKRDNRRKNRPLMVPDVESSPRTFHPGAFGQFGRRTPFHSVALNPGCAIAVEAIPFTAEVSLFYYTDLTAISLSAIGFLALATVLSVGRNRTPRIPGSILVAAAGLLVFSEIGWALFIFDQNAMEAAAAVPVGGGAILFIRFFARLRYLPVRGRPGAAST